MRRARRKPTSSSACSALIDLSLTGNLILIVVFSGYENFVSKIDPGGHPDWPEWMTKINFGGLKQKLMASIVAISAIQVLKAFMNIDTAFDPTKLAWLVGVHLVFVVSAFMLAISDRWSGGDHGGEVGWRMASSECIDFDVLAIRYSPAFCASRRCWNSFAAWSSTNSEPSATPK